MTWSYDPIKETTCPICGKSFIKQPEHTYKITIKGNIKYVCSWKCVRAYEAAHPLKPRGRKKKVMGESKS